MRIIAVLLLVYALCAAVSLAADKPELTRLYPAGGQAGTTVDVEATGKFPVWPVQIWSSSPDIQWTCKSDSGKLQATIQASVAPGLYWMRIYGAEGATAIRPFLVGRVSERSELEPNDHIAQANEIATLPLNVHGILNKRGDVDLYSVSLQQSELLVATIDSSKWLLSPADANLQVLDEKGFVLAENLDHVGLDPYLEWRASRNGKYTVRVFGFPANPDSSIVFSGGNDWNYRLRLDHSPHAFDDTWDNSLLSELAGQAIELAPGQHIVRDDSLKITLPTTVRGFVNESKQSRYLKFTAMAGKHYRIRVLAREFGSELDATVSLFDAQNNELVSQDDIEERRDPVLLWKAPADGEVTVSIRDFHRRGGPSYSFLAKVEQRSPDFSIHIANDLVSTTIDKELELVVNIVREAEFVGPIQVTTFGLPGAVRCTSQESKHGTDTASKVTLKLQVSEPYQGPLQIVAQSTEMENQTRYATAPHSKPIWLSITKE